MLGSSRFGLSSIVGIFRTVPYCTVVVLLDLVKLTERFIYLFKVADEEWGVMWTMLKIQIAESIGNKRKQSKWCDEISETHTVEQLSQFLFGARGRRGRSRRRLCLPMHPIDPVNV